MPSPSDSPRPESGSFPIDPKHPAYQTLLARSTTSHVSELTLGLLHKFNNLFTGATFLTEACRAKAEAGESVAEDLGEILKVLEQAHRYATRVTQLHVETDEEPSYHDLNALIAQELDLAQLLLPRGTALTHLPSAERLTCYATRRTISRILFELMKNCGEAIPRRGGSVTIRSLVEPDHPGLVRIEIHDNGPGFSSEILDHVFQNAGTTKDEKSHPGLGLFACRQLALSCGGDLTVRNDPEGGAVASFSLPGESPEGVQ